MLSNFFNDWQGQQSELNVWNGTWMLFPDELFSELFCVDIDIVVDDSVFKTR